MPAPEVWARGRWGDIVTLQYGRALRGVSRVKSADVHVPVYGTNGRIGWSDDALCLHPGVIIGRKGAYRGVHFSDQPFFVIDTAFYVEPKVELDMRWCYYALLTEDINGLDSGSAIPSTTRDAFNSLKVQLPPLKAQRAIGDVLGVLDDKIDVNRQVSARLNELVITVFKHMFQAPARSTVPLTDLAHFVNGKAFTQFANGAGRPILRIAELNRKVDAHTLRSSVDAQAVNIAFADDILFSWSGSLGVYRWHGQEALINQHIFKVIPKGVPAWLVYSNLLEALPFFRDTAADKATTMGHIQRRHLDEWRVPKPSAEALEAAAPIVAPAYALVHVLARQSSCLAELRDLLLPRLMSGEIPAPEAERLLQSLT